MNQKIYIIGAIIVTTIICFTIVINTYVNNSYKYATEEIAIVNRPAPHNDEHWVNNRNDYEKPTVNDEEIVLYNGQIVRSTSDKLRMEYNHTETILKLEQEQEIRLIQLRHQQDMEIKNHNFELWKQHKEYVKANSFGRCGNVKFQWENKG